MHEAQIGSNPSYLWRSLCAGKKVVDKGSIWRVGSGESIKIWEDNWVWQSEDMRVRKNENNPPTEVYVDEWIDHNNRSWRKDMIEAALTPREASWVLNIPLSRSPIRDKLIWKDSPNGVLTVRWAYVVALGVLGREVPLRVNRSLVWKHVWSAKIMPRVRNHCWKMVHDINPTVCAPRARGVMVEDRCPVYGEMGEDSWHAYFGCELSKQVWSLACGWSRGIPRGSGGMLQFWESWLEVGRAKQELELGLILCWSIWKNRNLCLHEGRCERAEIIVTKAKARAAAF